MSGFVRIVAGAFLLPSLFLAWQMEAKEAPHIGLHTEAQLAERLLEFGPPAGSQKLILQEFFPSKSHPTQKVTGSQRLKMGTALNVVIDQDCVKAVRALSIREGTRDGMTPLIAEMDLQNLPAHAANLHSQHWVLQRDWKISELKEAAESDQCVKMVSPDAPFHLFALPSDPLIRQQRHLNQIKYNVAYPFFYEAMNSHKPVVIAIIDSGVDLTHVELAPNAWVNAGEIPANQIDDDQNGYIDDVNGYNFADQNGQAGPLGDWKGNMHATHVAGLAAARADNMIGGAGVDGTAKIMSLNIFGSTEESHSSFLENAIRYAADNHADIINLSLGGREHSQTMRAALQYALSKGVFIVTAAGNDGLEISGDETSYAFVSPAVYAHDLPGMIAVASVDADTGFMSAFSNYSNQLVEIAAPGALTTSQALIGLFSTLPGDRYGWLAGTSMSAPVMSGAVALVCAWMKTYHYAITPSQLKQIFWVTAHESPDLLPYVEKGRLLDLESLAAYLAKHYPRQ